jgi:hypothetical protein
MLEPTNIKADNSRTIASTLSYMEVHLKIQAVRIAVLGTQNHSRAASISLLIALAGALFTIASSAWQPLHGAWNSIIGFALELLGGAMYFRTQRNSRPSNEQLGDLMDMEHYDALHRGYRQIIGWVATFDANDIEDRAETLGLVKTTAETANRWLFGPSEKLGALPAVVALLIQAPTLSGTHGLIATTASAMLVIFTLGFCALTLKTAQEQVRDKRLEWIFSRAHQLRLHRGEACASPEQALRRTQSTSNSEMAGRLSI